MVNPPDYLEGKVSGPAEDGPAKLLLDGKWCGHGLSSYSVFDIEHRSERVFKIRLPGPDDEGLDLPVVMAKPRIGAAFAVYDSSRHPASVYFVDSDSDRPRPHLARFFRCPNCGKERFQLSVGFEVPEDSEASNDTSWFALAAKCAHCGWPKIICDDETA